MRLPSRRLPALLLAVLPSVGAGPATVPPRELLAARDGGAMLLARPTDRGVRVEVEGEKTHDQALPAGVQLSGILSIRRGWVVYGVQPLDGGTEILLLERRGAVDRFLPAPGEKVGPRRESPVAVARSGRLHTLLWLEGERRDGLAVRAARWKGNRWSAPVTVSPQGPGSQLALSATILPDGELLAVWSAFDGEDDEILWSRTRGGLWTPPAALAPDNAVPDITPALAALPGGALAAWSGFDGEGYSLLGATFTGERWTAPVSLGGNGTLFPVFERVGGDLLMLCRRARPAGWEALRLDEQGRVVAQAEVASPGPERPVLASVSSTGVRFLWTDRSAEAPWTPTLAER